MWSLSLLALAASVAANPLDKYATSLDARAAASVSTSDFSNFKFYVQHAAAAYCNDEAWPGDYISCSDNVCTGVENNNAVIVDTFAGSETGIAGYVAVDDVRREIVFAVRGSSNIRNFITDILFTKTSCDLVSGCKVHDGFAAAWAEIKDAAYDTISYAMRQNKGYKLVVTGHSLGGAVAILGSATLRRDGYPCDVYTYGSPRVGNDVFANYVSRQAGVEFRITHTDDPVPRLPPIIFGYRHTTPEIWLSTGSSSNTNYKISDLKVCPGIANVACNAGTFGLDIAAHLHYIGETSGCAPFPLRWKRDDQSPTNEELEQRLNNWSTQDQQYVQS